MDEREEVVVCAGGCGKHWPLTLVLDGKAPAQYLDIRKAVRCWDCSRALQEAGEGGLADVMPNFIDDLDPHDRGALKPMPERPALKESPGHSAGNLEWE